MRGGSRTVLVCAAAAAVLVAALAAAETNHIPVFFTGELPGPVAADIGGAMQPLDKAPDHEVVATNSLRMYNAGWARVLDKARKKAAAEGGNALVITSWGFDPTSKTDVKKLERVKRIEFEVARISG